LKNPDNLDLIVESASNKASSAAKRHYLAAILTSAILSALFWTFFEVVQIVGFIFLTLMAALLGSSIGLVANRNLVVTILATLLIRLVIFVIMSLI